MEYKKLSLGGYNLHLIKTDKFKTSRIEAIFHKDVDPSEITKRQVLSRILVESNKTYPTSRKLAIKLEDLYDAAFYSSSAKIGNAFITNFSIDFLNPEYAERTIVKDSIELLFDMILKPNININEFDNKTVSIIKERVKDIINNAKDDPRSLSFINALKHLGDTPTAYHHLGSLDSLDEITPSNLYTYYQKMIKEDNIDIFVVGNLDMEEVTKLIIEYAKFNTVKHYSTNLHVYNEPLNNEYYQDRINSVQTNLIMILNLNHLTPYEEQYTAKVYNSILGQSPLKNKLFINLREKNSLCYLVRAGYSKYDGIIEIETGIDPDKEKDAIKVIKDCIDEMSNNITDDELASAKEQIATSLNCTEDTVDGIIANYFYQDMHEIDDLETRIKTYKAITKEDIYAFSKKVSISLTYALKGGSNE